MQKTEKPPKETLPGSGVHAPYNRTGRIRLVLAVSTVLAAVALFGFFFWYA